MKENTEALAVPVMFRGMPVGDSFQASLKEVLGERPTRFLRRYGILLLSVLLLVIWTAATCTIAAHNARVETEARMAAEYAEQIREFYAEEEARQLAANAAQQTAAAQMEREADAIARVIGTMATKRMKTTMVWNILARVDNPAYPGSVEAVIEQPRQWIFYSESNPIREDDRELALEQLRLWHEGRYPAGLSNSFVYGEWSESDYVLRDSWDRNSRTNYWRAAE